MIKNKLYIKINKNKYIKFLEKLIYFNLFY